MKNLQPGNTLFDNWLDRGFPGYRLLRETDGESGILAVDIKENDKSFTLKADFPGIKKEEIALTVDNNMLTLSAEHKEDKEEKEKGRVIRQERRYGRYTRSFNLGSDIDEAGITATFDSGVLTLEIPKAAPHKPKSKTIPIK
jgi:HSP20 family protein